MSSAIVVLDTNILSLIVDRPKNQDILDCVNWVRKLVNNNILAVVPEIADYESRRKLLCRQRDPIKEASRIERLNRLNNLGRQGLYYAPITTEVMIKAAELWALAKVNSQPTEDEKELAGDTILAAQAIILANNLGVYTIIATKNVGHLARDTHAAKWKEITIEYCLNPQPTKIASIKD